MKKYKCPACGVLTDYIVTKITGDAILCANGDSELNEWEHGNASCDKCGFEESSWSNNDFEIVEVEE